MAKGKPRPEYWAKKSKRDDELYGPQLGVDSVACAQHYVRRLYLLHLLHLTGKGKCVRCGQLLEDPNDLSLDHIKPWRNQPDAKELFWSIENLGYSHKACNIEASIAPRRKTKEQHLERERTREAARVARLAQEDPEALEREREIHRQKMKARYWAKREQILAKKRLNNWGRGWAK
jgi:hypothetical protein